MVPLNIQRIFPTPITQQPYGSSLIKPKGQITLDKPGTKIQEGHWLVIDETDLCGKPYSLVLCALAESLGILSFNNPPNNVNSIFHYTNHNSQTRKDFHNLLRKTHPSVANILSIYEYVFFGLSKMEANPVHFHLKPYVKPVIQPTRHIPYHLQAPFTSSSLTWKMMAS